MLVVLMLFAVSGYGHNKVVVIPMGDDSPKTYRIGDAGPAGGIVFQVTDGGLHGLEAAPEDVSADDMGWGCFDIDVAGVDNIPEPPDDEPYETDTKTGAINTILIVFGAECGGDTAAAAAFNYIWPDGTSGGFLPNNEELDLLWRRQEEVGGFASGVGYWSSSESDRSSFACGQLFGGFYQQYCRGLKLPEPPNAGDRVRAVRAF